MLASLSFKHVSVPPSQVKTANHSDVGVDSPVEYHDEGSGSGVGSLSSICSSLEEEERYSLERLRAAGPTFQTIAGLLEGVLREEDYFESGSEATHTTQ